MTADIGYDHTDAGPETYVAAADIMEVSEDYRPGQLTLTDAKIVVTYLLQLIEDQMPEVSDPKAFVRNALSAAEHKRQHEAWFLTAHAADYNMLHRALAVL